jgi:hypothetical protein
VSGEENRTDVPRGTSELEAARDALELAADCEFADKWAGGILAFGPAHDGYRIALAVDRLTKRARASMTPKAT